MVCGANSGYEVRILSKKFPDSRFTAVDISTDALKKFLTEFPNVSCVHASMESLPFKDKEFDTYLNCRAIHSTDVNTEVAVNEAMRVTKGRIILSVSNGYNVEGKIINGMYDYDTEKIDIDKPNETLNGLKEIFQDKYNLFEASSEAELFLIATPI